MTRKSILISGSLNSIESPSKNDSGSKLQKLQSGLQNVNILPEDDPSKGPQIARLGMMRQIDFDEVTESDNSVTTRAKSKLDIKDQVIQEVVTPTEIEDD